MSSELVTRESAPSEPGRLWVFTPSHSSPEDLEFILVQREELLKDAVERVRESALTDHKHHLLFVGPRGCGKTHLVTLIVSRLSAADDLADHLRLAWLNEDETCTTLLELLIKIHGALEKRYPSEFSEDMLSPAYDRKPDDALAFVSQHLLATLGSRTLLVVTENLDALFEGLGDSGQKKLRAFIQENPRLSLVATAQRLVKDLANRANPFFGFFQTEHLKPLNADQAAELLQKIARLHKKTAVVEFLGTGRGRARVRALHHLSGGNHRIYIVLSQFITRDTLDTLLTPFLKMVDELTPYYQERIRWLPPQQRKIVEYLCTCETTVPVKDIAKRLFTTPQSISSQLQDLRERGYVDSHQRGREFLYEISEPLMRICVEVKENQRQQPLRLLVDFLRVWYDDEELQQRLEKLHPTSSSRAYLKFAVEKNRAQGSLRKRIFLADLERSLPAELQSFEREDFLLKVQDQPEIVIIAFRHLNEGDRAAAINCFAEAIAEETSFSQRAILLCARARFYSALGADSDAIEDCDAVLKLPHAPIEAVAGAMLIRASSYGREGESQHEIQGYTTLINLPDAPVDRLAIALLNRSRLYDKVGDARHAMDDVTTLIGLRGAPLELVADALLSRGVKHGEAGQRQLEIDDYTSVINSAGVPVEQLAEGLINRSISFLQLHRLSESQLDLEKLISLPAVPGEHVVNAYALLALLKAIATEWVECFNALEKGFTVGSKQLQGRQPAPYGVVQTIFSAGLTPQGRRDKISTLIRIYEKHSSLSVLGEAVVLHIGNVFSEGAPFPSSDNLEDWVTAWEQASENAPDFRLSMRLLRTGVDYVKAGGKDPGILLNLTSTERDILKQALGLSEEEPSKSV